MAIRITCIKKEHGYHEDPHHAISQLGWLEDGTGKSGNMSRVEMHDWIKNKNGVAYVTDGVNKVYVKPHVSRFGTQFVQTEADSRKTNNLLHLPECN